MNVISSKANIGNNFEIGNFNTISDNVIIGNNVEIGNNITIIGNVIIGDNVKISDGTVIGGKPQHLGFVNGIVDHIVKIGSGSIIRECVTINQNTDNNTPTTVGENCFIMAYSHISHDTILGDDIVIANSCQIGGHSFIDDYVTLGGGTLIHQKTKIGKYCMTAGGSVIFKDVAPFSLVGGNPASYYKVNLPGLRRNGFTDSEIKNITHIHKKMFKSGMLVKNAIIELEKTNSSKELNLIIDFLSKSERGLIRFKSTQD